MGFTFSQNHMHSSPRSQNILNNTSFNVNNNINTHTVVLQLPLLLSPLLAPLDVPSNLTGILPSHGSNNVTKRHAQGGMGGVDGKSVRDILSRT